MKKHLKSGERQNHKKPMNKEVLQEEFSGELGDINAYKWIDVTEHNKKRRTIKLTLKRNSAKRIKKTPLRGLLGGEFRLFDISFISAVFFKPAH
nr:hypothetical protein [Bacillus sp. NSP9.1]